MGAGIERVELRQYMVADRKICYGKLTFRGTRVFGSEVSDSNPGTCHGVQLGW